MNARRLRVPALILFLLFFCCCSGRAVAEAAEGSPAVPMELQYAEQFTVDARPDGTRLLTIGGTDRFLLVPKGAEEPADPEAPVLRLPLERVYLAASSAMDFYRVLDALDQVRLTSTKPADWSLPEVRDALEQGSMLYTGKYSAPDYEMILSEDIRAAIESTMIYHSPAVRETLQSLGIPVLVERSSYESHPLGRLEWIRLYGLLTGREKEAEDFFARQISQLSDLQKADSGKTVAFFHISTNGYAVVRKPGDYISKMIALAGGEYILQESGGEEENALSTMNMEMERFFEAARDADIIIYNSPIDGEIRTTGELLGKSELLADFKAVKEGNVWCTGKNMFQQVTGIGDMIVDMNKVITGSAGDGSGLTFLHPVR